MPASSIYHFAIPLLGQFMVYYRSKKKKKKMEAGVINENRRFKKSLNSLCLMIFMNIMRDGWAI